MDTFRSIFVNTSYQVLVDFLCDERNHRRCRLADGYQSSIQSHISVDLILFHSLCPETFAASSYIPVAHVIYKFLKSSGCFRDLIII